MPTGTKGLITNNWHESEFISKPNSTLEILGADKYNDGVTDDLGRNSQRFIGDKATVNMNPDSGKVTTVWKTGKATRKKYTKKG